MSLSQNIHSLNIHIDIDIYIHIYAYIEIYTATCLSAEAHSLHQKAVCWLIFEKNIKIKINTFPFRVFLSESNFFGAI